MRPILNSQPGKNRFSHCYIFYSKVQAVDPNTLSKTGRLAEGGQQRLLLRAFLSASFNLTTILQAEITDFALRFGVKVQWRQGFLVQCPIVVRHNFLKRHFFLWLIYLFSFECSLNPPFLFGTTAAAYGIGLPSLNDCEISFILEQDSIKDNNGMGLTMNSLHSCA